MVCFLLAWLCDRCHAIDAHRHFCRGQQELLSKVKRVTKKIAARQSNTQSRTWDSRFLVRQGAHPAASLRCKNDQTRMLISTQSGDPLSDQDLYESLNLAFDTHEEGQPQRCSVPMPTFRTYHLMRKVVEHTAPPHPSTSNSQRSSEPYLQLQEQQPNGGAKFLCFPSLHGTTYESPGALASIEKTTMEEEDWLSSLEKLFDVACHHAKRSNPHNSFHIKTKRNTCQNGFDKAWSSSWNEFLEPRPLRMNSSTKKWSDEGCW